MNAKQIQITRHDRGDWIEAPFYLRAGAAYEVRLSSGERVLCIEIGGELSRGAAPIPWATVQSIRLAG